MDYNNNNTPSKFGIAFNAPVTLGFMLACLIALGIDKLTSGASTNLVFSVYNSSFFNPLSYIRLFGHVLGHANWAHFYGNIMFILLLGPLLEEKYGSSNLLFVIMSTALVTGLIHIFLYSNVRLLGASGVVFAFILLSSMTCFKDKKIPVTFILVALIYIGEEVYKGMFYNDNTSNLTHIIGGAVGSFLGFLMNKYKMSRYRG